MPASSVTVIRGAALGLALLATSPPSSSATMLSKESFKSDSGYTVNSETYWSTPMDLSPGEMVFTETSDTPIEMPDPGTTGYAIVGFSGEIVDENGASVPLSEVYDHHWVAVQKSHQNALCGGDPEYVVGIGAESRNTATMYPEGYGYYVGTSDAENLWGANIHLLRTEYLAGDSNSAAKECNECFYADTKGPMCTEDRNGTFFCCGQDCPNDTCYCPIQDDAPTESKRYYLQYQVNYTYDVDMITPVDVGVITAPDCQTFFGVYENNDEPETLASYNFDLEVAAEVVYAIGHLHVGAINISMYVNDKLMCTSYPRYGTTPDQAGDEYGYLVEISPCINKDTTGSLYVVPGDNVRIDAYYWVGSEDERITPHPGGTHLNVMAYMYLGYIVGSEDPGSGSSGGKITAAPKNTVLPKLPGDSDSDPCIWWGCSSDSRLRQ